MKELPLVSLCMATYNQERYVKESLESAAAQDYPNLEIVVSDDGSTDGSVDILRDIMPPNGVLLANRQNVGIAKNYERAYSAAKGELLVTAGGDDISIPNRISRIVEEWLKDGRRATVIAHGAEKMWMDGSRSGEYLRPGNIFWEAGYSMTYHHSVVSHFPAITHSGTWEDLIYPVRGAMLGGLLQIDEPLVLRRIGGMSTVGNNSRRQVERRTASACIWGRRQNLLDIEYYAKQKNTPPKKKLLILSKYLLRRNENALDLVDSPSFLKRLRAFIALNPFSKSMLLRIPYLLPRAAGDWLFALRDGKRH